MEKTLSILVVPDKGYPLQHPLLKNIFNRILPNRGHKVIWLLPSYDAKYFGERCFWGNTEVYLTPFADNHDRLSQIKYLFYTTPRSKFQIMKIARKKNVDVIFVRNDLAAAIATYLTSRKMGIPFVFYLGFPKEEAIKVYARRGWSRSQILPQLYGPLAILLKNWLIRRADFVFTMSDFWRDKLIDELSLPTDQVLALPFGFDTTISPQKVEGSHIRKTFGLNGYPMILYIGAIGPPRDMTILVDIMAKLVNRIPEIRLLILVGARQDRFVFSLNKKFADHGLSKHIVFAPTVPSSEVPSYIAAADVGLSPIERCPIYDVSSPAKFVEMLGMGLPVVASDIPEQKKILEETRAGICVPFEASAFSDAIFHILQNPSEAREMGKRGRQFVENKRSFVLLANSVEETLTRIVEKKNAFK